jgi:hypothetical protein
MCSAGAARGGLLDILKEGPSPADREYQRVAFVGEAKVRNVEGKTELLAGIERWVRLREGTRLRPGDVVRTGEGASVLLQMVESGSLIRMTPRTVLRLTPLEEGWDRSALSGKEEKKGYSVRSVRGKVLVRAGDLQWEGVEVNSVLPQGAIVRTDPGAWMDLFHCESGKFVRVQSDTQVVLSDASELTSRSLRSPTVAVTSAAAAR